MIELTEKNIKKKITANIQGIRLQLLFISIIDIYREDKQYKIQTNKPTPYSELTGNNSGLFTG